MIDYYGKKVVIIGLGVTGLSCVIFFLKHGVVPYVMDSRDYPPGISKLPDCVKYCIGGFDERLLLCATLIVVSPGVNLYDPLLVMAANYGIEIIGDIELFLREITTPIIAITGSNGKSTVTKLISEMAISAGLCVGVGGNIGVPVLTLLNKKYHLYILELSSFQLETIYNLQATVAVLLNISEDHMDRYPYGFMDYCASKLRIFHNAKICVFNALDVLTYPSYIEHDRNQEYLSFGDDYSKYYLRYKNNKLFLMLYNEVLLNCTDLKIFGYHNYMNVIAALTVADLIKVSIIDCLTALKRFIGLPHRLSLIYKKNNILWINDSKSTNTGSTKAALSSLFIYGRLHLLLGGYTKCADFSLLKEHILNYGVCCYCFGKNIEYLYVILSKHAVFADTLKQSMYMIRSIVRKGDIVLLSPACSSIDQFKNFQERGNVFTYLARMIG